MEAIKKIFNNKYFGIFIIILWMLLTLTSPLMRSYTTDEIHALNIAKNFNLFEIIQIMRAEGHTFLWYMLIKPFTYFDSLMPWAIKVVNYIFMLSAIILLWIKAPFNNITKFAIIFSYPLLTLYPPYARPYGIGIFLLFLLALFYKKRLNHPILYSILIFLTANTSLMNFVGASAFGLIFFYDIIKEQNKKHLIYVSIIAFITCALLYIQWHNPIKPDYIFDDLWYINLRDSFIIKNFEPFNPAIMIPICFLVYLSIPPVLITCFKNNKRVLFFTFYTFLSLLGIFSLAYAGFQWHHMFFYIYIVIAYWLFAETEPDSARYKNTFIILFCALTIILSFRPIQWVCWGRDHFLTRAILKNNFETGSTLFMNSGTNAIFLIYDSEGLILKDLKGNPLISVENYLNSYIINKKIIDLNKLKKEAPPKSYLIVTAEYIKLSKKMTKNKNFFKNNEPIMHHHDKFIFKLK